MMSENNVIKMMSEISAYELEIIPGMAEDTVAEQVEAADDGEDVVFIVTDDNAMDSAGSSAQYDTYELQEVNHETGMLEEHDMATIAEIAQCTEEMELTLDEKDVEDTVVLEGNNSDGSDDENDNIDSLSHLTKREYANRLEYLCPTVGDVIQLRDELATQVRSLHKNELKGDLKTYQNTSRLSSKTRYTWDCHLLQRVLDGDEQVELNCLVSKSKKDDVLTNDGDKQIASTGTGQNIKKGRKVKVATKNISAVDETIVDNSTANSTVKRKRGRKKLSHQSATLTNEGEVVENLEEDKTKETDSYSDNQETSPMSKKRKLTPNDNKSKDKVNKMKQLLKKSKEKNMMKSVKMSGTIKGLKEQLRSMKAQFKAMEKTLQSYRFDTSQLPPVNQDNENSNNIGDEEASPDLTFTLSANSTQRGGQILQDDIGNTYVVKNFQESEPQVHQDITSISFEPLVAGTQRGRSKLYDSRGYTYTLARKREGKNYWRCTVRSKKSVCPASVVECHGAFQFGNSNHTHKVTTGLRQEVKDSSKGVPKSMCFEDAENLKYKFASGVTRQFKFECSFCDMAFAYRKNLEAHNKEIHGAAYVCELCDNRSFAEYNIYKEHILCVHTNMRPFVCATCNKSFHLAKGLKRHEITHGPKIRSHICYDCGKGFHSVDILTKHIKTHSMPSHLCNTCGKMFKTKNNLRAHVNIHTRERVHACSYCSKDYTHPTHLAIHIRRHHTGERPFICSYCGKGFVSGSDQRLHEKRRHSEPSTRKIRKPREPVDKTNATTIRKPAAYQERYPVEYTDHGESIQYQPRSEDLRDNTADIYQKRAEAMHRNEEDHYGKRHESVNHTGTNHSMQQVISDDYAQEYEIYSM